jgi:T-box
VHLVRRIEGNNAPFGDLEAEQFRTYVFPETVFTAVTAYQNQLVSGFSLHFHSIWKTIGRICCPKPEIIHQLDSHTSLFFFVIGRSPN